MALRRSAVRLRLPPPETKKKARVSGLFSFVLRRSISPGVACFVHDGAYISRHEMLPMMRRLLMALFDFLKGGAKKAENDAATAAELQKTVEAMDLGISGLHVAFAGGVATIRGVAPNQKNLEIARLVLGNHESVEKVQDDGLTVA